MMSQLVVVTTAATSPKWLQLSCQYDHLFTGSVMSPKMDAFVLASMEKSLESLMCPMALVDRLERDKGASVLFVFVNPTYSKVTDYAGSTVATMFHFRHSNHHI